MRLPSGAMGPHRGGHYFDADPATPSARTSVELVLPDVRVRLVADRHVFSGQRVDAGTKLLLLEAPAPPPSGDVVDLGCGYGPIAVTLGLRAPGATVWAIDVNRRALALTAENAAAAGAANVRVATPDDVPADLVVAALYSNPPIRIGKAALHALLEAWLDRLAPGAQAHLVVQRHLGADSLHRWLEDRGHAVSRRCSRAGYRVLDVAARP